MVKLKKLFSSNIKGEGDLVDDFSDLAPDKSNSAKANVSPEKDLVSQTENQEWLDENLEGQLSVDVYQDKDNIVIKSTIAGVKPEDIDIAIHNDLITIKGRREAETQINQDDYFYQECYWGKFSRSIILPVEVKAEETSAELKNGILTITLPKARPSKAVSVKVSSE